MVRTNKIMWILKSLLASYIVTGIVLLLMTFLVYRFDLDEQKVTAGIVVTYILSTFVGGFILGKLVENKRFFWGLCLGVIYFLLLFLISFMIYREVSIGEMNTLTTMILCLGGGMLGGMFS